MTEFDLYNATRHKWKVGQRREKVKYAIASYRGIVREVYAIENWKRCEDGRYEFEGQIASTDVRDKYLNQSLENYILKGSRNPIKYIIEVQSSK